VDLDQAAHENNENECLSLESVNDELVMPILRKNASNGQTTNRSDRGMFSVSRVKKVELAEIPLASDICTASELSKHLSRERERVAIP
jgi:hypothetical protein